MGEIIFSVVVPIYQIEKYIRACVDSILSQTFLDYEVILVDDGSTDGCGEICDSYERDNKNVVVIHKENGGLVSARNAGIKRAQGQYICYVDGDDKIASDMLEKMYHAIKEQNTPDMVIFGGVYDYGTSTEEIPCHLVEGYYDKKRLCQEIYPTMIYDKALPFFEGRVFPSAWNKLYKRELLLAHYCRDERIGLAEDNAFTYECLYYADSVYVTKEHFYYYNKCNDGSMVSSYNSHYYEKMQLVCEYLKKRLGSKEQVLDEQINAFCAGWIIMSVFHEVRHGVQAKTSISQMKTVMRDRNENTSNLLKSVSLKGLPGKAKIYIGMLKAGAFSLVYWSTKRMIWRK